MKLTILFGISLMLATIQASPASSEKKSEPLGSLDEEWASFKTKFNKSYKNAEDEKYRKEIFAKSLKRIKDHNKKYDAGEVTFNQGINHLADLTVSEYRAGFLGLRKTMM